MGYRNTKKADTSSRTRKVWALVITAALFIGSLIIAFPPQDKINQGLDIKGGLSVVLVAKAEDGQQITSEDMEKAKSIIESRVNALGATEATVQIQGSDQILVQIPGLSDSSTALATIGKTGVLEFARLDSFADDEVREKIDSGSIIDYSSLTMSTGDAPTGALSGLVDYDNAKHIIVESGIYEPLFTGDHITQVTIGKESDTSQYYAVNLRLDSAASQAFANASTDLLPTNGKIVILLDGEVNSAPAIQSAITTGEVSITGNYTLEDAKALQTVLDSGSLPVSFQYEQSQTVGPTLGQGELSAGLLAMLIGIIVVMAYLLIFYRGFGLIPAANMIVFSVIYLGVLGALSAAGQFSLSLAGIAGIILSIGMTADSVILAIEKMKEEMKEGRSVKSASIKGVRHALVTSVDADVVSLVTALCLFFFATSSIKGFGLTLALGILCDILVMFIFVTPLIRLLAPRAMRRHPAFWGIKEALLLGDVRTGSDNYMLPEQAKESAAVSKEKRRADKKRAHKAAADKRERDRKADAKAREIKRDAKLEQKAAKKKKLEEIKAEDARRDEERKAAKRAARKREKDAQAVTDEAERELDVAVKADEKAARKMDRAEEAVKRAEEAGDAVEAERELDRFEDALDEQAKADDDIARLVEKLKEAKAREDTLAAEGAGVGDAAADADDAADAKDVAEAEGTTDAQDTETAEDVTDEDADSRPEIEARTSEEIASIIAATSGIGAIVVEDEEAADEVDDLVREAEDGMELSGPDEDPDYGVRKDYEKLHPSSHRNRAQRRADKAKGKGTE